MRLADETSAIKTEASSDCALIGRSEFQKCEDTLQRGFCDILGEHGCRWRTWKVVKIMPIATGRLTPQSRSTNAWLSGRGTERQQLSGFRLFNDRAQLPRPRLECSALLGVVVVAIVDTSHGRAAFNMI
jgi:hypothetical protein